MAAPSPLIVFAGTPEFAAIHLQALLMQSIPIHTVYTQPDKPAGRGRQLQMSPVKKLALEHGLSIRQPLSLKNEDELSFLRALKPDLFIVVAYGLILPEAVLNTPRVGCINVHASILPRWRGAAPIQRAILAGDHESGVCIMRMDIGLDTGGVFAKAICPIYATDTSQDLHDRLAALGSTALIHCLPDILNNRLPAVQQDDKHITYASKITKQDASIQWQQSAVEIERTLRAFNPWPVAFSVLDDITIRIWSGVAITSASSSAKPGTIVNVSAAGLDVATGAGLLRLHHLQLPGKKTLPLQAILNAKQHLFLPGKKFK